MAFRSFQSRLLVLFLGLFVGVQAIAFWAVHVANVRNARAQISGALEVGAGVFRRLIEERGRRLVEAARLLSGDFAFKSAWATGDPGTILSALGNHQARIGAGVMILADLEGGILADTLHPGAPSGRIPFAALLEAALAGGGEELSGFVLLEGRAYQMVVVPLLAPVPSAWIGAGFEVDDRFAEEFRRLALSHVTLLRRDGAAWTALASTLPAPLRGPLAAAIRAEAPGERRSVSLRFDGEAYVALVEPLPGPGTAPVVAVLQRSLDEALRPYLRLRSVLIGLFGIGAALTIALGALIARSVSRPVLEIAAAARRVEEGDYSRPPEARQQDEIGRLAASFRHMVRGLEERDRVRGLLGKVVAPEIARELLARPIELGGEEREVTILFADVRGFTSLCEDRPPREILSLLNAWLTRVTRVVETHGGVVDKYVGDAVMALFGAPLARADAPARAVRTALDMARELGELNGELAARGLPALRIGIGINSDLVVAGNMGSETRLNYTVVGDGVNLASRIEGLTKAYGLTVLASEATRAAAPGFVWREVDRVRVKGKARSVALFEPLGPEEEDGGAGGDAGARRRRAAAFAEALDAYRRAAWDEAGRRLEAARDLDPADPLPAVFLARIDAFRAEPPGPEWDGVFEAREK